MRTKIAQLGKSKALLAGLVAAVALAVVGTTLGYQSLKKDVTLSLDGQSQQVSASGSTVADVLESQDIKVGEHDVVAPGLDESVSDGTKISVRFGRQVHLDVDGKERSYWVTATDVAGALDQIGRSFNGADLSMSRGAGIDRSGVSLDVVTPKSLKIKIAKKKVVTHQVAAATVGDVLKDLGVKVDKDDEVTPKASTEISDGTKITVTRIKVVRKDVKGEEIDFETVEKTSGDMYSDESETTREGVAGLRDVTYRLTYRNGELVATKQLTSKVTRKPVSEVVTTGTKERPEPEPAPEDDGGSNPPPDYEGGSTVWDQLAQCESGGNWGINTGNGFQGGLQFSPSTWSGYGGGEFAATANQATREQQIIVAERVLAGQGWGAWPSCSSQLGLSGAPQERTLADFDQAPAPAAPEAPAAEAEPTAEDHIATLIAEAAARGIDVPADEVAAQYNAHKDEVDGHYVDNKEAVDNFMATYFGSN